MRFLTLTMVGTCLAVGFAAPALALTAQEEAALQQNCGGDYLRLCAQFDPNSPQVEQCFKDKNKELSPGCRTAIQAYSKQNPSGRKR